MYNFQIAKVYFKKSGTKRVKLIIKNTTQTNNMQTRRVLLTVVYLCFTYIPIILRHKKGHT